MMCIILMLFYNADKTIPKAMKGISARRLGAAAAISSVPITIESPYVQYIRED
jgi:hypothetical protein